MKHLSPLHLLTALLLILILGAASSQAQEAAPEGVLAAAGTVFTYQGRLTDGDSPANGNYDFQFRLYDTANGGGLIGSAVTKSNVGVSNGLFTVDLDFGAGAFAGDARWLRIDVRPNGVGAGYTTLSPRQALTAAPYALHSLSTAEHDHWGKTWTGVSGAHGLRVEHTAASGETYGLIGVSASTVGVGVSGQATASSGFTAGVMGESASTQGAGVFGRASADSGAAYGVWGRSDSSDGRGVYGVAAAAAGATYGVYGESASSSGVGVYGMNVATSGPTYGVAGQSVSTSGMGVLGNAAATSGFTYGVYGQSASTSGVGVTGDTTATTGSTTGVLGKSASPSGIGVSGVALAAAGATYGVYGYSASPSGYAGYFNGKVHVNGTLSKSAGSFKIDHPLDPTNQYLYHSFVESPDMKNIYDGVAALDASGAATVMLPAWFEALNRDFRYQLTPIGAAMPDLHVAQKIQGNTFRIAGGKPGMEVSWQVTGIRHDPYAEQNRIAVEEPKPADERGTYLYPQGYGQPESLGRDYQRKVGLGQKETDEP